MIHWLWLIVAFFCGGFTAIVCVVGWLTQGFKGDALMLWSVAARCVLRHKDEVLRLFEEEKARTSC